MNIYELFAKYLFVVGEEEGVYFLDKGDWTPEEWQVLQEIVRFVDEHQTMLVEWRYDR